MRVWIGALLVVTGCGGEPAGEPAAHEHAAHEPATVTDPHAAHGAADPHAGHVASGTDPIAAQQARAALASTERVPEGLNAVQNEMLLLEAATRDIVTAVANDDLEAIPARLHRVHGAKALTGAAIAAGAYRTPKNPDQIDAFVAMDEAFHTDLVRLLDAALADDLPAATAQLGVVLQACTSCHEVYRFP